MVYMGGKFRIAKALVAAMQRLTTYEQRAVVAEPFCGGAAMTAAMSREWGSTIIASDASADIIAMWKAAQEGHVFPREVSEEEYAKAMADENHGPNRGFILFGCSYGGKYKGGYARGDRRYAECASNAIARDLPYLRDKVTFECRPFNSEIPRDGMVYCDPPYGKATGYSGRYDKRDLLSWIDSIPMTVPVFVSEWDMPEGYAEVWSQPHFSKLNNQNRGMTGNTERLYMRQKQ